MITFAAKLKKMSIISKLKHNILMKITHWSLRDGFLFHLGHSVTRCSVETLTFR
ncbi:hypothetical protein Hanom_Chr07g00661951 [Helianthus anomalus]